ncbi:MAG: hypothetical protein H6978_03485 [Gammaproteobacteria bacterium]|nr:hypothetical protein [Gammaproteobacteria bacterium]
MARFEFHDENAEAAERLERTTNMLQMGMRGFGIALMIIGAVVMLRVMYEGWALYRHPERIGYFVTAIEQGTNLDQVTFNRPDEATGLNQSNAPPFRIAYFAAWIIVILLLLLVCRLALGAIRTGTDLAMHDARMRAFVKLLAQQGYTIHGPLSAPSRMDPPGRKPD